MVLSKTIFLHYIYVLDLCPSLGYKGLKVSLVSNLILLFCFATVYLPVSKSGCATKDQLMSQRTLQGVSQFSHSVVSDSL